MVCFREGENYMMIEGMSGSLLMEGTLSQESNDTA